MNKNNSYIIKSFMKRFLFLLVLIVTSTSVWAINALVNSNLRSNLDNHINHLIDETVSNYRFEFFFAPPTNDFCEGAKVIVPTLGKNCDPTKKVSVDLTGSTVSGKGKPGCDTGPATVFNMNDQWYKFTATSQKHKLIVDGIVGAGIVYGVLYHNVQSNGTVVTCNNIGGNSVKQCFSFNTVNQDFTFDNLVAGKEYLVRFYTAGPSTKKFNICLSTPPPPIKVSPSGEMYSVEELIKDVLVSATCDLVSNVKFKHGNGSPITKVINGIGYFSKNGADFAYESGIVLSTGDAWAVGRHYLGGNDAARDPSYPGNTSANRRWSGDKDLIDLIEASGGFPPENWDKTIRSSEVEFDFIPVQETISFEYLFGSNSYYWGCTYECGNGAMFGAWLIDTTTGIGSNIAVLPGTTNTPISMGQVRDITKMYNPSSYCVSVNPQYFDRSFDGPAYSPAVPNMEAPVDLGGISVPFKSPNVKVVPGRKYHIKLAVLDFCPNPAHTSAAFFKAGSFDIGKPELGTDMSIEGGNAACPGETVMLGVDLDPKYYLIQWTKDGKDLIGENGAKLAVTSPGLYGAKLSYKDVDCEIEPQSVLVEYYDEIILEKDPENLTVCNSGKPYTNVDLSKAMTGVTFSDVSYTYHETKADAEDLSGTYIDPNYQLDNSIGSKLIWVRIKRNETDCFVVRSFKVDMISCTLALADLPNMEVCKEPNQLPVFDLTQYSNLVYYGTPGYTVTYYKTETDAKSGTNPIVNVATYPGSNGEKIWVRVQSNTNPALNSVTSFSLVVYDLPKAKPTIAPLVACLDKATDTTGNFELRSKDNEITQSASGLQVTYYSTLEEAEEGDKSKALNKDNYVSGNKEIFYRLESLKSGCFVTGSLVLKLSSYFEIFGSEIYYQCSQNGYANFNLEAIAGAKTAGNVIPLNTRYYRTYEEALSKVNPIVLNNGNYTNELFGGNLIYLRVENQDGCYQIQVIELRVERAPETKTPSPIELCASSSGQAIIVDITIKEDELLNNLNPDLVTVRYYSSYQLAQEGKLNTSISDPEKYANSMGNTIYVRVESKATNCFSIESIVLKVNPLPSVLVNLPDYTICDSAEMTGIGEFNLGNYKLTISSDNEYVITYHKTNEDAINGSNLINEKSYKNETPFSQIIYVKIKDAKTGCYVIRQLFLKVNAYPFYNMTTGGVLTTCTSSSSAQGEFNLVFAAQQNIPNQNDFTFSFYENLGDARAGLNNIKDPESYKTQQVKEGKVWIRIIDKKTGCIGIYEINLRVEIAPILPVSLPLISLCDNFGDAYDGVAQVDLTMHESIVNKSLLNNHAGKINYYRTLSDAETDTNRIVDPTIFTTQFGGNVIWYRLTDLETGCYAIESFEIEVNIPLRVEEPNPIVLCSDLSIGQNKAKFNLKKYELAIIGGNPIFGVTYQYFESELDAKGLINPIPANMLSNYVNKTASQNIWIVVTNEVGCSSVVIQKITAEAMPEPNMSPRILETCENEFGKGVGTFNLTTADSDIRKGDKDLILTYFRTEDDALANDNALTEVEKNGFTSQSGIVYVRVENNNSTLEDKCFVIVELMLKVNLKPSIVVSPYVICLETPLPNYTFDLSTKNNEVLNGRNATDFRITYHLSLVNANGNTNALVYDFTNTVEDSQTIYVRLEDRKTGCFHVVPLLLQIEQEIYAYPLSTPSNLEELTKCSNATTGTAEFNFSDFETDILGELQLGLGVKYYLGEENLKNNNAIDPINKVILPVGKHTVIAVVKNPATNRYCKAETRFVVEVLETPVAPKLKTGDIVCVDYTTGKLIEPYVFDSGFDSTVYDFQWEYQGQSGRYSVIPGATNSYYVVDNTSLGNRFRVVVNYKGGTCKSSSATATIDFVPEIDIKVKGADSTGLIGSFDDTDNIIVEIQKPTDPSVYEFALDGGAYQDSRFFYDVTNGSHRVWVRFKDNRSICPQYIDIFVLGYPKFFTPNGDGFNDTWNIKQLQGHPEAVIYIFDRYGKLITQLKPSGQGWDGTFNGKPLPATDYWFTVEYLQEPEKVNEMPRKIQHKGHFSLKR